MDPPVITTHPVDLLNQIPGTSVQFSVVATGESLTYQWQMDGVALTDGAKYTGATTNMLTVANIQFPADEGSFNVIVSNGAGSDTSDSAMLDVGMLLKPYFTVYILRMMINWKAIDICCFIHCESLHLI